MLDNPHPPAARRDDFVFRVVKVPKASAVTQGDALEYWKVFKKELYAAIDIPEVRTVVIDGDNDSWELQRLAEFGKLEQIPPLKYTAPNAARRAMIARCFDSGKTIIATNKIERDYKPIFKEDGTAVLDNSGKQVREWDGTSVRRQGFADTDYLYSIQLRHLKTVNKEGKPTWGIKIMDCKPNMELVGEEIWGDDCNFPTLVSLVYPHVELSEWGL